MPHQQNLYYYRRYQSSNHQEVDSENSDLSSNSEGPIPVKLRRAIVIMGLLTIIAYSFVLGAPYWRSTVNWYGVARLTGFWGFEGLFLVCFKQGYQALTQCYHLHPIMGAVNGEVGVRSGTDYNIYPYLTSFRGLMIVSLIFSIVGTVCSGLGLRCATILEENSKQKRYVIIGGGCSHILSATLAGICVSWYAAEVIYEFYSPYYASAKMKFSLGACLYVGWVSMTISLLCGCLMTCCICCTKDEEQTDSFRKVDPSIVKEILHNMPHSDFHETSIRDYDHFSRRNSRYPDLDISDSLQHHRDRRSSRHSEDRESYHKRDRRQSRQHDLDHHHKNPSRRSSRQHDHHSREDSKHHDFESRHHSNRRSSKADHHSVRRESRKISLHPEEIEQLISAIKKDEISLKSSRSESITQTNEDGFI